MVSPELLRRYPYFAGIGHETLKKLAMLAEERTFSPGETLFREWQRADYLFVVLSGEVEVRYTLHSGEYRTVDTVDPGELLVWSALLEPYRTTGTGVAVRPTRVIALEAVQLRELCRQDPVLGYNLMAEVIKTLVHRLDGTRVQLAAV